VDKVGGARHKRVSHLEIPAGHLRQEPPIVQRGAGDMRRVGKAYVFDEELSSQFSVAAESGVRVSERRLINS